MRWFGEHWGAPVCDTATHAETPVGGKCVLCGKRIEEGDRGFLIPELIGRPAVSKLDPYAPVVATVAERPWHLACMMESVLGPEWESILTGTVEGERILRGGP